jgi:hypothetical protein
MNYIIEDGIDFYAEMNKNYGDEGGDGLCLISGQSLGSNHIELPCGHKFNYVPLYLEIVSQKRKYNPYNMERLMSYQIKCPYCRNVSDKLIPFIPVEDGVERMKGVNSPDSLCMSHHACSWVFKSGKNKNSPCKRKGFETDCGKLCEVHWKSAMRKKKPTETWTEDMEKLSKHTTVAKLKNMLRAKGRKVSGRKKDLILRVFEK